MFTLSTLLDHSHGSVEPLHAHDRKEEERGDRRILKGRDIDAGAPEEEAAVLHLQTQSLI